MKHWQQHKEKSCSTLKRHQWNLRKIHVRDSLYKLKCDMIANQIRGTNCQLMKEEDSVLTMKLDKANKQKTKNVHQLPTLKINFQNLDFYLG